MVWFQLFLVLHIVAGFVALAVFAIPILSRKGGRVHVVTGWIYTWAMSVVAVSAWVMGIYRIGWDPDKTAESVPLHGFYCLLGY
ncbi:hypothetical protein [Desmospora activa]|uniref:hypothetical protein n=1 Tax=Desmospora activa TaxID=500615 RepID=UPI00267FAB2F